MDEALTKRIVDALLGRPLVNNVFRGTLVEAILAKALEPDWTWCSGADAWAGYDFVSSGGLGLEVKQSAALQAWYSEERRPSRGVFDIAARKQQWDEASQCWKLQSGRAAFVYVLAWHPVDDPAEADHRHPAQWEFYPVKADQLPNQKTISLGRVRKLAERCDIDNVRSAVEKLTGAAGETA